MNYYEQTYWFRTADWPKVEKYMQEEYDGYVEKDMSEIVHVLEDMPHITELYFSEIGSSHSEDLLRWLIGSNVPYLMEHSGDSEWTGFREVMLDARRIASICMTEGYFVMRVSEAGEPLTGERERFVNYNKYREEFFK